VENVQLTWGGGILVVVDNLAVGTPSVEQAALRHGGLQRRQIVAKDGMCVCERRFCGQHPSPAPTGEHAGPLQGEWR
jgi:hypothetical protein